MGIQEKGNAKIKIYRKKIKKIKKVVDIKRIIWYINEATCRKEARSIDL